MIWLIYGENSYALLQDVRQIRHNHVSAYGEHSVRDVNAADITLADFPQLFQGASLFAADTLVIIRDAGTYKTVWDGLGDYLETAQDISLVIVEAKPDKRTRTYKWLSRHGVVKEHRLLDEAGAATWCFNEAKRSGIDLTQTAAKFLVEYCGTDQWALSSSLDKLALLPSPVTSDVITAYLEPHPSASVFSLLDAMLSRRRSEAMRILKVVESQEDPYMFMGLLATQLYTLALVVNAEGRSPQHIAQEASQHPYVVQKLAHLARQLNAEHVARLVRRAADCDATLKSSGGEPWMAIRAMIGGTD